MTFECHLFCPSPFGLDIQVHSRNDHRNFLTCQTSWVKHFHDFVCNQSGSLNLKSLNQSILMLIHPYCCTGTSPTSGGLWVTLKDTRIYGPPVNTFNSPSAILKHASSLAIVSISTNQNIHFISEQQNREQQRSHNPLFGQMKHRFPRRFRPLPPQTFLNRFTRFRKSILVPKIAEIR